MDKDNVYRIRSRKDKPEVRDLFFRLWETRTDTPSRLNLLWRLLDYEDLEKAWHEQLYGFVRDNWDEFLNTQRGFMGGGSPANVLPNITDRLGDASFPEKKAWAYLCSALASEDMVAVRELLRKYENTDDEFTASIVRDMLDRIGAEAAV